MAYFSTGYALLNKIIFRSCNHLERSLAPLEQPASRSAALVLFVGRRYYLRPISAVPTTGTPAGLIAATRARVCDGNAMNVR